MAFDHTFMKVRQETVELPNGHVIEDYFIWEEGTVALVVPVTKDGKFVLVKQYKHAAGEVMLEFPAGMANLNEDPKDAAQRELVEETGYTSPELQSLAELTNNPTKVDGKVCIYLAENAAKTADQDFDENENIEVVLMDHQELLSAITTGKIKVTGSVSAAFLALKKLELK